MFLYYREDAQVTEGLHHRPRSCLGVWLRFLVSFAHGTDRKTIQRLRKLSGHHHPKRLQNRRGLGNFDRDAYRVDRGQRRANERTSRQDFGVLKARKQSRVVKKLFYPFRLVLLAIDGVLFDVHENGVPPSNCSNDFKSDHAFR